ncbi:hypothetical protein CWE12_08610 [Aliidiomarina sedimenti]|uniref:Glycosyl transferase family 1 domain-containing protein n=1 Tax=Aliidiomarina sedimenti TaxID=1933879 RepID=A0ABY0BZB6_9GAMM|nr:glycosyltransferase [Aliidiomarina sedimenti]RUO30012.1 hypothetical protein CWE12_08610 [Aliidiomarina sedimenti]
MKRILVLSQAYPSKDALYSMAYVHSRNIEYVRRGIGVDVLSFSNSHDYEFEGINVLGSGSKIDFNLYDAVVSHAPNIRSHYLFFVRNLSKIKSLTIFFHGHEALKINQYYPKPFSWNNSKTIKSTVLQKFYDSMKLRLLKGLLRKANVKVIYVSEWMRQAALSCMNIPSSYKIDQVVINNAINNSFYTSEYRPTDKLADFVTIRPFDEPKYAVDLVVALAKFNPDYSFHLYGSGKLFEFIDKPNNLEVFNHFVEQKDIPSLLNRYRAAVMPTRLDAQGVMMCEMASYGVPLIISDLPVCREMLSEFDNCIFVNNAGFSSLNISSLKLTPLKDRSVVEKFSPSTLAQEELNFILSDIV